MDYFNYKEKHLYAEKVALQTIAKKYGTPCYVYSKKTILRHYKAFDDALGTQPHTICYAVKANSNLALLQLLAKQGSGFDVVSKGELQRVLHIGADPKKIVFSGVGKTTDEINFAIEQKILCINIESLSELKRVQKLSFEAKTLTAVSLRINPNINPNTHPYISTGLKDNKFGIDYEVATQLYYAHKDYPNINFIGIDCHIGSQITTLAPFMEALDKLIALADTLAKNTSLNIQHLDLGGGLGVNYQTEQPPAPHLLAEAVKKRLADRPYHLILEPGRAIMANAGILLTSVEYIKSHYDKKFAIVDAAMTDLLRPALYQAWHDIIPVLIEPSVERHHYDIVGGVCETGDFLGHDRALNIKEGSLLAIRSCGAYGFTMSSHYNSRPKAAEVLVDGDNTFLIRARENFKDLIQKEIIE